MKRDIIPILLILIIASSIGVYAESAPVVTSMYNNKQVYSANNNFVCGKVSIAKNQRVILYDSKGNPLSVQRLPNHGNSADYKLPCPTLNKGKNVFIVRSEQTKNVSASNALAVAYTLTERNTNTSSTASNTASRILDAAKEQAKWMKNYTYSWQSNPTIAKSKKRGTCVTYVACVLQRINILNSGECIWHNGKGKVDGANNKMTVNYPKGTLKSCKNSLKAGDIIISGDKKSINAGGNSHIFIFTGKYDKKGNPMIYDNGSCTRVKKGKTPEHSISKNTKVIATIRCK